MSGMNKHDGFIRSWLFPCLVGISYPAACGAVLYFTESVSASCWFGIAVAIALCFLPKRREPASQPD